MSARAGRPAGSPGKPPWMTLVALYVVTLILAFQLTAVLPVIPTIRNAFHAPLEWSTWLLSGYLMVATVLTPTLGRLGDLYGAARVLLISLVVFLAGSVGAATVPSVAGVIVFRAIQGTGGAVLPLSLAVIRRRLPDELVGPAIAGLTGVFGLGATLGFATGGLMAQAVSWRLVFATGAVGTAAGIVFMYWVVPRGPGASRGTFDTVGAAWLGGGSLAVLLALTFGSLDGWASPVPVAMLAAAVIAGVFWVRTELHCAQPVVDLRVLRNRGVLLVNLGGVGLGWARFTTFLLIPELVRGPGGSQYGFSGSAAIAGLYMVPAGFGLLIGGPMAGVAARWVRPGHVFAAGLTILAAGTGVLAGGVDSPLLVLIGSGVTGLGGGLGVQASSAVVTRDVPAEDAGVSASVNGTLRRFSGGVGGQVSIIILAGMAVSGAPSARGFVTAFAVAGILALAGAGLGLATPRAAGRGQSGADGAAEP